jgi:hypothetical protein
MGSRAQNMKTGADALGIAENGSESAKHENWTRRPRYCPQWVREKEEGETDLTKLI